MVRPQIAQNPRKRFGLSFYGGEPLLNIRLVTDVLGYCRGVYPSTFLPVMTTNGLLLTPEIVETLVEHDVMLAISIDGPPAEHDRRRSTTACAATSAGGAPSSASPPTCGASRPTIPTTGDVS